VFISKINVDAKYQCFLVWGEGGRDPERDVLGTNFSRISFRFVPEDEPIDLMNVAFELQPKQTQSGNKMRNKPSSSAGDHDPYLVPDRVTGLSGLEELTILNPKRKWNFIEVNITVEELKRTR
jgi:hypothetical protein